MSERVDTEESTVTIPDHLAERIDRRIEGTRFESHEEYVVEALTQLLIALENETEPDEVPEPGERQTAQLETQLESLGYL